MILNRKDCMKKTKLKSYGKINLYLELINKRKDGYHNIKTIMQNISLHDEIIIEEIPQKKIIINSNFSDIPKDINNTAYKAAYLIIKRYNIDKGLSIYLKKVIPHSAGLAGGSSNGAAIIVGLNRMWNLNMSREDMEEIADELGADVFFFLRGGTSYIKGKGNIVKNIKDFSWENILIIKPEFNISTADIYKEVDIRDLSNNNEDDILNIYNSTDKKDFIKYMKNDLEKIVNKKTNIINKIKEDFINTKALISLMTGSGSCVFALYKNTDDMKKAKEILRKEYNNIFITNTIKKGFDYEE